MDGKQRLRIVIIEPGHKAVTHDFQGVGMIEVPAQGGVAIIRNGPGAHGFPWDASNTDASPCPLVKTVVNGLECLELTDPDTKAAAPAKK